MLASPFTTFLKHLPDLTPPRATTYNSYSSFAFTVQSPAPARLARCVAPLITALARHIWALWDTMWCSSSTVANLGRGGCRITSSLPPAWVVAL